MTGRNPAIVGEDGVAATIARASSGEARNVAKQAAADVLTGRFTHLEEVADLLVLLSSDGAGDVTGADFVIDAGLITTL
jgi:NAD(P)-dependent dehydrogenase (short-subunit alcohol dehydrogenase family)